MKTSLLDLETVIITRRTVVRRFREQEGKAFYELFSANAFELQDLLPPLMPPLSDAGAGEFFVRQKLAAWLLQESFHFAVWDKDSAQLIGYAALDPVQWDRSKTGLNAFIDKNLQSKGIMSEVTSSLLNFAFNKLGLEKVVLEVSTENVAAQRLARKCGFIREGDLREEYRRISGEPVDVLLFGITRSMFEKI